MKHQINREAGALLRELREDARMSQNRLSKEVRCTESLISRYEAGEFPSQDFRTVHRITKVLIGAHVNRIEVNRWVLLVGAAPDRSADAYRSRFARRCDPELAQAAALAFKCGEKAAAIQAIRNYANKASKQPAFATV